MRVITILLFSLTLFINELYCQNEPVIAGADTAVLGADFEVLSEEGITFIRPLTDYINTSNPGSVDKIATFFIHFADTGTYDLYVKVRAGSGSYNDDSFFSANGFGDKSPVTDSDWFIVNNIVEPGFSDSNDVVTGGGNAFYIKTIRFIPDEKYFSGIEDQTGNNNWCSIYPNPFSDGLTIDISDETGRYSIYDLSGKKIESGNIKGRFYNAGKNLLPKFYILKIETGNKSTFIKINKL